MKRFVQVFALLAAVAASTPAHAVVRVRSASQLAKSAEFTDIRPFWRSAAAGMVVYDQCAPDLHISEDEFQYMKAVYDGIWNDYLGIYSQLYAQRVGYMPDQAMVSQFSDLITAEQHQAASGMMESITAHGCHDTPVKRMYEFFRHHRAEFEKQLKHETPATAKTQDDYLDKQRSQ